MPDLIALYLHGKTYRTIAEACKCSITTVVRRLKDAGVWEQERFPYVPTTEHIAAYQAGATLQQIATDAGVTPWTVTHAMRRAGVYQSRKGGMGRGGRDETTRNGS